MPRKQDMDKITCRCLRRGQWHTNTLDWYVFKKHRNCPACGGEMDFKMAFSQWMKHQITEINKTSSSM